MVMGFDMDALPVRATDWNVIKEDNPRIEVREVRPLIHRPLDCDEYKPIYRPMRYEYEGACENFDYTKIYCVFCAACMMSNAYFKIPFDVRTRCDEIMGW